MMDSERKTTSSSHFLFVSFLVFGFFSIMSCALTPIFIFLAFISAPALRSGSFPGKKKEIIINLSMNWPILNTSEWQRTGHTLILVNTRYKVTLHNEVQRDWVEISSVCSRTCGPLIIFLLHMNHVIFEMLIFLGKSTPCRKLSFTLIIMENILMFYPLQPFCTVLSLHSNIPIWCKNITFILCKVTGVLILHCLQMQLTQTYL